jgi:hypothetical protein
MDIFGLNCAQAYSMDSIDHCNVGHTINRINGSSQDDLCTVNKMFIASKRRGSHFLIFHGNEFLIFSLSLGVH